MTNIVDSLIVYTNIAFQLMTGEAGRFAEAFKLPIPNPIPPQAVERFELPQTQQELQGSITVSNFTFKFERGYLDRFYHERDAFILKNNLLLMGGVAQLMGQRAHVTGPLTQRGEESLRALGATDDMLPTPWSGPVTNRVEHAPRSLAVWRTDRSNLMVEGFGTNETIVAAFFATGDKKLPQRKLIITNTVASIHPTIIASQRAALCGSGYAAEGESRALVKILFAELKSRLNGAPLKAVLANENLNQPQAVADELQKLAGDVPNAVISIGWTNPPYFPEKRLEAYAASHRGVKMLFVAGEVDAHLMRAEFLREKPEDTQPGYAPNPDMTRDASELVQRYKLNGPQTRNLLFALPSGGYSQERLTALGRMSGSVILPIGSYRGYARSFVASLNGQTRTNEPIALLLTGLFGADELKREPEPLRGLYAPSELVEFGRNDLVNVYGALTETGVRILETAQEAEVFRVWNMSELISNRNVQGPKLEQYTIKKVGAKGGRDVAATLAEALLQPHGASIEMTACAFDPGLAFRISTPQGTVTAFVCLGCGAIEYFVRDPQQELLAHGTPMIGAELKSKLAKAGLKGLPGDRALLEVKDYAH